MFKNRTVQVSLVKKEDPRAIGIDGKDVKSEIGLDIGAQVIVVGSHLTKGVISVIAAYMLCDTVRKIAINNLSK